MRYRKIKFVLVAFAFIFSFPTLAQQKERPKIGVVLSGGGAKGFAHVGFLKALEEAGIKPDYITGTSMGAIVGALYSIGYSADEIAELAHNIDWSEILDNNVQLNQIAFEEKAFFDRYLTELTVKDKKVYLPSALIEGQNLQLLLSKLTQPVHHITCFDSLPIPFACLAADIENGEPILLHDGNLAEALRASMAIPTIFTPVIREGRVLVDGGLIRNFPVEEVKHMGADIILGSYVGGKFKTRNDLNNFTDILKQSAFITSIFDSRNQAKLCDFYVETDLTGYTPTDFHESDSISARGYKATSQHKEYLRQLSDSIYPTESAYSVSSPKVKDTFYIEQIKISGNKNITDRLIEGRLQLKKSHNYTFNHIEKRINTAFGTQYFDKISYSLVMKPDSTYTLQIDIKEKPKTNIKVALHYDTETNAGVLFNVTSRNFLLAGSKLIGEFDFATQPRANINYIKYIGKRQLWAITAKFRWVRQSDIPALNLIDQEALYTGNSLKMSIGAQSTFSTNFTFGAEFQRNLYNFSPTVNGDSLIDDITEFNYLIHYFWNYNSTDDLYFPTKGLKLNSSFLQRLTTDQDYEIITDVITQSSEDQIEIDFPTYNTLNVSLEQHFTFFNRFTLTYFGYLSENFSEEGSVGGTSFIGGVHPIFPNSVSFYGDKPYSFIADNIIILGGKARYKLANKLYITGIVNYADTEIPAELKNQESDAIQFGKKEFNRVIGGGLELSYKSFLGPIRLAAMQHNETEKMRFYFGLGFNF